MRDFPPPLFEYDPQNRMAKCYVIWLEARVAFILDNKTLGKTMLGICGYSGRVFKVASPNSFSPMLIHDIFINDSTQESGCEEGKRCLDFNCSKNRTTWESYKKAHSIRSRKSPEGFGNPIWCNVGNGGELLSFKEYFEKYPTGAYIAIPEADIEIPTLENKSSNAISKNRNSLKPGVRFDILKRDGFRCQICGRSAQDGVKLEIDHKHPVAKGGDNNSYNLWVLCNECNIGKGTKTL